MSRRRMVVEARGASSNARSEERDRVLSEPDATTKDLAMYGGAETESDNDLEESFGSRESSMENDTEESIAYETLHELENLKRRFEDDLKDGPRGKTLQGSNWQALVKLKQRWSTFVLKLARKHSERDSEGLLKMLRVLGPEAARLMKALSVQINDQDMLKGRKIQLACHRRMARIRHGCLDPADWWDVTGTGCASWARRQWETGAGHTLEAVAPKFNKKNRMGNRVPKTWNQVRELSWLGGPRYKKVKIDVHWSGMCLTHDMISFLKICHCVHDIAEASEVFDTPLGDVLVQLAHVNARAGLFRERIADFLYVSVFYVLGTYSRNWGAQAPGKKLLISIIVLNLYKVVGLLVELWTCKKVFGTLRPLMTTFTMINWIMELVIGYITGNLIIELMRDQCSTSSLLYKHPVLFAVVTLLKWSQFLEKIMTVDVFIDAVLPAWYAVFSRESLSFITMLLVLNIGSALAYLSLPVLKWDSEPLLDNLQTAATEMFQLNMLTSFNERSMGGYSENVSHDGIIRTFNKVPVIADHMPLFMVVNCFIFSVVCLNLYIGILSSAYDNLVENLTQLKGKHTIASAMPHLLVRHFWHTLGFRCDTLGMHCELSVGDPAGANVHGEKHHPGCGFWFSLPHSQSKF